jgi:hypothetical protein
MMSLIASVLGSFGTPMQIDTTSASMLWLLPLVAAIAIVYKATKVSAIRPRSFLRECAVLFGSIMVFVIVAALILFAIAWIITEQLPKLLG